MPRAWRRRRRAGRRPTPAAPALETRQQGSTTQPACATVDHASSRTESSWRRATGCRGSCGDGQHRDDDQAGRAEPSATAVTARRAARPARRPWTYRPGTPRPAAARRRTPGGPDVERHERELEADAGQDQQHRDGSTPLGRRGGSQGRGAGEGRRCRSRHTSTRRPGRAGRRTPARWSAAGRRRPGPDGSPGRATRATTGRVASSRVTSHEPRSRAAATPVAPAVAASSRATVTAVREVSRGRSAGQASRSVTPAASKAASWSDDETAVRGVEALRAGPPVCRHSVETVSPSVAPRPPKVPRCRPRRRPRRPRSAAAARGSRRRRRPGPGAHRAREPGRAAARRGRW